MAWNGSGVFSRTNGTNNGSDVWEQDKGDGTKIVASLHDVHDEDLADGIQACLAKNGENAATADLPMGGFIHTGVGAGTALTHYARLSQVIADPHNFGGTSTGAANVFAFSLPIAVSAYATGQIVRFIAHQSSTGACTLNANSVGSIALTDYYGVMGANSIRTGDHVVAFHNGTNFVRIPMNGARKQTFTLTLVPYTTMVLSSVVTLKAVQGRDEAGVSINASASFTVDAGTPTDIISFNVGIAAVTASTLSCSVWGGSGYHSCNAIISGSTVQVRKLDGAFTAGALRYLYVSGTYPDA